MIFTFPPESMICVVRMPICVTVPRKSPTTMMSPTSYWCSNSMNVPVITSAIKLSAPKPMISASTPAPASSARTSTPTIDSAHSSPTMISRDRIALSASVNTVLPWLLLGDTL